MPRIAVPQEFVCPLTNTLINEPVFLVEDDSGQLFEKQALVAHFEESTAHPVTGEELDSTKFNINHYAKKAIKEFKDKLCTELELLEAVKSGNIKSLRELNYLESSVQYVDPSEDETGIKDNTPLHFASKGGNMEVIKLLISEGASLTAQNSIEETPLETAIRCGNLKAVKLLFQYAQNIKSLNLCNAAYYGYYDIVSFMLSKGVPVDNANQDGLSPLLCCIKRGHLKIVQLLLENKANVSLTSPQGKNTPLHKAVKRGHPSLVKLLIDYKCDPNVQNRYGDTPLMIAVKQNNEDIIKMLLENKADASITNADGRSPLHEAINEKNLDIVKLLVSFGANVNAGKKSNNRTALFYVSDIETAKFLIKSGGDINVADKNKKTPLHVAVMRNDQPMIQLLLEYGANVELTDKNGNTPLQVASEDAAHFIRDLTEQLKNKTKTTHESTRQIIELQEMLRSQQDVIRSQQSTIQALKEENEMLKKNAEMASSGDTKKKNKQRANTLF